MGKVRKSPDGQRLAQRVVQPEDVPMIKGMLCRGDAQSDIAAFVGTNGGRIADINTGKTFAKVAAAPPAQLPPPGPYLAARSAFAARAALQEILAVVQQTLGQLERWETAMRVAPVRVVPPPPPIITRATEHAREGMPRLRAAAVKAARQSPPAR